MQAKGKAAFFAVALARIGARGVTMASLDSLCEVLAWALSFWGWDEAQSELCEMVWVGGCGGAQ